MALPAADLNIGPKRGQVHASVQIPVGSDGNIDVYLQEQIAAGLEVTDFFEGITSPISGCRFSARADGPTTSGGSGARSELRASNLDGTDYAFNPFDGQEYTWEGTSAIVAHPTSGADIANIGIVLAQLHNGTTDRATLRTQFVSGTMRLRYRINGTAAAGPGGSNLEIVASPNATGTNIWNTSGSIEFAWRFHIHSGNGTSCTIDFYINGSLWHSSTALASTGGSTWYWKAGCYNNFDESNVSATAYGRVVIRPGTLKMWQTGWPAPNSNIVTAPTPRAVGAIAAQATSSTVSPALPASMSETDYVTVQAMSVSGGDIQPPAATPAWDLLGDTTIASGARQKVFGRAYKTGDDATPDFTGGGGSGFYAVATAWQDVDLADALAGTTATATGTAGAATTYTLTGPDVDVDTDLATAATFVAIMDNIPLGNPTGGAAMAYGGDSYTATAGSDGGLACAYESVPDASTNPGGVGLSRSGTDPGGTSGTSRQFSAINVPLKPRPAAETDTGAGWWAGAR